jgi:hypothetical protein
VSNEPAEFYRRYHTRSDPSAHTIFHEDWWLEAASNGAWDRVEIGEGSSVRAVLPFLRERYYGAVRLTMPPYTRTLGPSFSLPDSKSVTRIDAMRSLTKQLIEHLPRFHLFRQILPPEAQDKAFAFTLNGWHSNLEYTFRITNTTSPDDIWKGMSQKTRNLVRTSRKRFEVKQHGGIGNLVALSRAQFAAKRVRNTHRYSDMTRIFEAALVRDQAVILSAFNDKRQEVAAVALVWDQDVLYLWNTARDPTISGSGALSLLIWETYKLAQARGLVMDFDGFATPATGRFLASFGATPIIRPIITYENIWSSTFSLLKYLRNRSRSRPTTS